jgi:hypothetical protein
MEGADSGLQAAMPNSTAAERLGVLFDEAERKGRDHTPKGKGAAAAVGYKTAKTLAWDSLALKYGTSSTYDFEPVGPVLRASSASTDRVPFPAHSRAGIPVPLISLPHR